jgi:hypothetical protein
VLILIQAYLLKYVMSLHACLASAHLQRSGVCAVVPAAATITSPLCPLRTQQAWEAAHCHSPHHDHTEHSN